jgi:transcriptional regulator GlxA family with amidase domain
VHSGMRRRRSESDFTKHHSPGLVREETPSEASSPNPALSVGFVLLPQFTLMALAGFVEALRHAADIKDRSRQIHCRWSILGPDQRAVKSSCGVAIAPWKTFADEVSYDYLAVVGGLLSGHGSVDPAILRYVKRAAAKGTRLIGLCTGSFALARAGLMEGRRCCVSYYHVDEFEQEFAAANIRVVADALFVVDGPRITCAGGLGAVDLAVYLLERHLGSQRAQKSVVQMIFDNVRPPTAPQPRFDAGWYSTARNPVARRAVLLMELHVSEPFSVSEIAAQLGISVKKLERLFHAEFAMPPASFYKKIRLEIARKFLKETMRPIMNIALDCGFGDISYFGRAFRTAFGASPREYRRTQSVAATGRSTLASALTPR